MADVELVIRIPEEMYAEIMDEDGIDIDTMLVLCKDIVKNGILIPKGYGRLISEAEIRRFLKCPEYEKCDWRNCYDCSQSYCINLNNLRDLVPIIEEESEE